MLACTIYKVETNAAKDIFREVKHFEKMLLSWNVPVLSWKQILWVLKMFPYKNMDWYVYKGILKVSQPNQEVI